MVEVPFTRLGSTGASANLGIGFRRGLRTGARSNSFCARIALAAVHVPSSPSTMQCSHSPPLPPRWSWSTSRFAFRPSLGASHQVDRCASRLADADEMSRLSQFRNYSQVFTLHTDSVLSSTRYRGSDSNMPAWKQASGMATLSTAPVQLVLLASATTILAGLG